MEGEGVSGQAQVVEQETSNAELRPLDLEQLSAVLPISGTWHANPLDGKEAR